MIAYMFACLLLVLVVLFMAVPLGFAWLLVASGGFDSCGCVCDTGCGFLLGYDV